MFQNIKVPFFSATYNSVDFIPAEQLIVYNNAVPFPEIMNSNTPCKFDAIIDQENAINIRNNASSPNEGITVTDDSYFSGKVVKFKGKIVITKIDYMLPL